MKKRLALLTLGSGLMMSVGAGAQILAQDVVPEPIENRPVLLENKFPSFADLVEELIPSVVNISTTIEDNSPDFVMQGVDVVSPEIREFMAPDATKHEALGSGFIIDDSGLIVTNAHVVDKAAKISVILHDNSVHEAKIVGKDAKTDVAVIKIETTKKLKPVKIGDSDRIRVGDWILAIGNPFGLGGSVSSGIVSAKSRDIESGPYDNFIQTDASINQGSSGGPMFNTNGEVIGINTAIFSTNGMSQGVGFSIPMNLSKWVIEQIKNNGSVKRGWIGIKIQPVSPEMAKTLGLEENQGVLVSGLTAKAPAQRANIQVGDVILSYDDVEIDDTKNFSRMVAETPIGKMVKINVWRNKASVPLQVRTEELVENTTVSVVKAPVKAEENTIENGIMDIGELDIKVKEATNELLEQYSLREGSRGVVIVDIMPGSDAAQKGLKVGDLIVKIDNKDVLEFKDITTYINDAKLENNRPVLLLVQTLDVVNFVAVKLKPAATGSIKRQ